MYNKINQLLINLLGVKITRLIKPRSLTTKNRGSQNLIIEFLGPPGVGKSTFCRYYLNHHKTQFKKEILTGTNFHAYLKGTRFTLKGMQDKVLDLMIKHYAHKNNDPVLRYKGLCSFKFFLDRDFLINHYLKNKIIFLDEERLLHFFLEEGGQFTKDEFSDYLKNRVFICCYGSTERVVKHIKKRAKKGHILPFHRGLKDGELYEFVDKAVKNALKRYEKLKKLGGKTVKINIDDPLEKNREVLDLFLQKELKIGV